MELAIPLIALGGMYVISNQSSQNREPLRNENRIKMRQENFTNMGKQTNYLPNTNVLPQNFPVTNINQLVDTVQEYPNPNARQLDAESEYTRAISRTPFLRSIRWKAPSLSGTVLLSLLIELERL